MLTSRGLLAPDPSPSAITRRARRSAASMVVRQVAVHGLNVLAGTLLARRLAATEFGVFGMVTYVITFMVATSDLGLGAGLVRGEREPEAHELQAVLTLQHLLTIALAAVLGFGAPALVERLHLPPAAVTMFRILALTIPVTALQTVSSIRLERHLEFQRLAGIEVAQAVVYTASLLAMVYAGVGLPSFAIAVALRALTGAALALRTSPWPIRWRWEPATVSRLLHFGLPYQGVSLVSLLKDAVTPVFVTAVAGPAALGRVNWAMMVSAYPVLALFALQRVYLPAFARLQGHPDDLRRVFERVLLATNAIVAPLATLTLALIVPLTTIVFGERWRDAIPLVLPFWVANLFVPTATPVMGLLNALGRSRVTFGFAALWMVLTWALGAPAILRWGPMGFAVVNAAIQLTNVALVRVAQRDVPFRALAAAWRPWLAAALMGAVIASAGRLHAPHSFAALTLLGLLGLALYAGLVWWLCPELRRNPFDDTEV